MSMNLSRRALGGLALAGAAVAPAAAQSFPQRNFRVLIPTGQGGGADRLARSFDDGWTKHLGGRAFEYEFFPGASGQVGYELFVQRRDADAHNLLFGNMGPEMIMYALQRPRFRFPEDLTYFCRIDIDDNRGLAAHLLVQRQRHQTDAAGADHHHRLVGQRVADLLQRAIGSHARTRQRRCTLG